MTEFDSELSININESQGYGKKTKLKKKRFYGNKNFRNRTRDRYLGKNRRSILNTAKVSISKAKEKSLDTKTYGDGTSTALHFDTVSHILAKDSRTEITKKHGRKVVGTKAQAKVKTVKAAEKVNPAPLSKPIVSGPWKSSLFNQNPEIPKITQPEVMKIQEEVFSAKKFAELEIHPYLVSYIQDKMKLETMTSIQQNAIPVLLSGNDALVKSQTGSGKTLAYAVPIIQKLQEIKPNVSRKDGPLALILTPTRELALQSYEIISNLVMPFCRIVPTWIIGGENRKSEKSRIRKGVNIVIGTPGRILDHIQTTESLLLKNLQWLIFDEADRLLDMGFQKQIDSILNAIKEQSEKKIQTVLLSATLSDKVERLASLTLKNPAHVYAQNQNNESEEDENDDNFALPSNLTQHVAIIPSKLRLVSFVSFLKSTLNSKVLVFLSCRDSVEFHYNLLKHILRRPKNETPFDVPFDMELAETEYVDPDVCELHGGMSQKQRQEVFLKFSTDDRGVLLTTDVAARGLDLPSVNWVVQYTSPGNPVDYIHRVGRTARAGKKGNALLMLTPSEAKYVSLLTQYNISVKEKTVDDILTSGHGATRKLRKNDETWQRIVERAKRDATDLQNQIESYLSKNIKMKTLARTAYMSFIRAYASYPTELKSIFHVKYLHLGHVAKSFGLQDAPKDIVKTLQKSVGHLPVRTSFEYREAKKVASQETPTAEKPEVDPIKTDDDVTAPAPPKTPERPRLSRKQVIRNKMSRKPDLMSEFSSGFDTAPPPVKKVKR